MTYKMFLDDIRNPREPGYVVVRSFYEAANYVKQHGYPSFVAFDHDLGESDKRTGYDFAKWLMDHDMRYGLMPKDFAYSVHSANPVGAANIRGLIDNYLKVKAKDKT